MPTIEHHHGAFIIHRRGGSDLVQTDWDYPATAGEFGWSLVRVQPSAQCDDCGADIGEHCDCLALWVPAIRELPRRPRPTEWAKHPEWCSHTGTDGTIDCPDCGVSASAFIAAAGEFLDGKAE